MRGVITGFAVIWVIAAVGYLISRHGVLGSGAPGVLARLVFFVATPALLFATLATSTLRDLLTRALAAFVLSTLAVAAIHILLSRLVWRRTLGETTIGALAASYVNAGNLGLPIAAYVLGDVSVVAPILLFQMMLAAPTALAVLDVATGQGRPSVRQLAMLPARNPVMLASVAGIGVAATGWHPPEAVLQPFTLLGAAAVPAALLAFGMSLPGSRPLRPGPDAPDRYLAVFLKVLVQPAFAYLIGRYALGLEGQALLAAVVTSALPTAQNVFVFATRYRRAESLARDSVMLSTIAAAVAIVAIAAWLG
ncbi:AEC family transporter [Actinopolymorpha alba]|uniref:AEC family transporter n=1 Tax=Actinopolymorpha alba TaxID=533267 RepID=UPI0003753A0B|nr:AEC family transporter [Actinopolymorpha alba]